MGSDPISQVRKQLVKVTPSLSVTRWNNVPSHRRSCEFLNVKKNHFYITKEARVNTDLIGGVKPKFWCEDNTRKELMIKSRGHRPWDWIINTLRVLSDFFNDGS